jgi:hypothetical protein
MCDRRIIAVKARHPFIMREADRGDILLQLPSKSGFTGSEKAMNQVSRGHWGAKSMNP